MHTAADGARDAPFDPERLASAGFDEGNVEVRADGEPLVREQECAVFRELLHLTRESDLRGAHVASDPADAHA